MLSYYLELISIIATFLAVALVSGNNLSVCVGTAVGARIVSARFGGFLGASGFALGLLLQGGSMTVSADMLLANRSPFLVSEVLFVTVFVFVFAKFMRAPFSLTMALVSLLAGISVTRHLQIKPDYIVRVALIWLAAPLISIVIAAYALRVLSKTSSGNLWRRVRIYKVLLLLFSFFASYVLGANTLGFVVALGGFNLTTSLIAITAIFVGSVWLSSGEIRRVGKEMFGFRYSDAFVTLTMSTLLVQFGTILNVPVSNTETLSAAVFGVGLSYRHRFLSAKPFATIVLGWVLGALFSFAIGLIM